MRRLLLLVAALAVAAVTAVMARNFFAGGGAPEAAAAAPPVPVGPEVLVAVKPLPVGTILTPDSFRFQPWPKELIERAYYLKDGGTDLAKLAGTVVRTAITAGQPITQGSLVHPGDRGFLAAALQPGMRAVTVSVTAHAGVAGFVFPGDRVDLMLAQEVTGGGQGAPLRVSETIVRNIRVLATDQRTENVPDKEGKTTVSMFSNVTLEATPKIAEKIAVATTMGTLSLSLRPLADDTAELERAIASGEVDVPSDARSEREMLLRIAQRPSDTDTTYTVGGDVSRFQRRSVPAAPPAYAPPPAPVAAAPRESGAPLGPTIRVARGNVVTATAVGGR